MCTTGDATTNGEGFGCVRAGHLENWEAEVAFFWRVIGLFCPFYAPLARVKTRALLTND